MRPRILTNAAARTDDDEYFQLPLLQGTYTLSVGKSVADYSQPMMLNAAPPSSIDSVTVGIEHADPGELILLKQRHPLFGQRSVETHVESMKKVGVQREVGVDILTVQLMHACIGQPVHLLFLPEKIVKHLMSLLVVMTALSFGNFSQTAFSDDGALVKELKKAVRAGKLTKEEAAAKLAVHRKSAAAKDKKSLDPEGRQKAAYSKIEAAVKSGKMTKKEAAAKLAAMKSTAVAKGNKNPELKGKMENYYSTIEAAVKAGKLTKEEASAKLAGKKKAAPAKSQKDPGPSGKKENYYSAIEAAVKAGKLTKEQAVAKLSAVKKASAAKGKKDLSARNTNYDAIGKKLLELVKDGLLSETQARAMLAAARKVANAK